MNRSARSRLSPSDPPDGVGGAVGGDEDPAAGLEPGQGGVGVGDPLRRPRAARPRAGPAPRRTGGRAARCRRSPGSARRPRATPPSTARSRSSTSSRVLPTPASPDRTHVRALGPERSARPQTTGRRATKQSPSARRLGRSGSGWSCTATPSMIPCSVVSSCASCSATAVAAVSAGVGGVSWWCGRPGRAAVRTGPGRGGLRPHVLADPVAAVLDLGLVGVEGVTCWLLVLLSRSGLRLVRRVAV